MHVQNQQIQNQFITVTCHNFNGTATGPYNKLACMQLSADSNRRIYKCKRTVRLKIDRYTCLYKSNRLMRQWCVKVRFSKEIYLHVTGLHSGGKGRMKGKKLSFAKINSPKSDRKLCVNFLLTQLSYSLQYFHYHKRK
jgi:hypothetical protein